MSDDEDSSPMLKKMKVIHYGSLEENIRAGQGGDHTADSDGTVSFSGNIHISEEFFDLEEESALNDKKLLLEDFERKKRARQINVSTDDAEVKSDLRQLGEPICYFGEDAADRRKRLRQLLARLGEDAIKLKRKQEEKEQILREKQESTTWYHDGPELLRQSRYFIANYSLPRAKARLEKAREAKTQDLQKSARLQEIHKKARTMTISCSQIGAKRPLSFCRFSPNSEILATGAWGGECKLWQVPTCEPLLTLDGHAYNIGAIVFHPQATLTQPEEALCMASCAADGSVKLWNMKDSSPIAEIDDHKPHRVSRMAFHPSGRFFGTCCFDNSWRLWDVERQLEVLHQEGHSRPVYSIDFHPDGSLAGTGGMDSFGRIWDLRTGRCIMFMDGHLEAILSINFANNGYMVATGSKDNAAKVWDLRQRKCIYTIPAHTNLISQVMFEPSNIEFLMTASYDNTMKIWATSSWSPLQTLSGHNDKVMQFDIAKNGSLIASVSSDKTFKLWMPELQTA